MCTLLYVCEKFPESERNGLIVLEKHISKTWQKIDKVGQSRLFVTIGQSRAVESHLLHTTHFSLMVVCPLVQAQRALWGGHYIRNKEADTLTSVAPASWCLWARPPHFCPRTWVLGKLSREIQTLASGTGRGRHWRGGGGSPAPKSICIPRPLYEKHLKTLID